MMDLSNFVHLHFNQLWTLTSHQMCHWIIYDVEFVGIRTSTHITTSWLEICWNGNISKLWTISIISKNSSCDLQERVDLFPSVWKQKWCFRIISLPLSIWDPLTRWITSKNISVFRSAKYNCWSLIITLLPKSLWIHSVFWTFKN